MTQTTFSKSEIRSFLVRHFGLERLDAYGSGKAGILNYIKQVGSLQQDPLNIIGTNPDIILASRFSDYRPELLRELLYSEQQLVEGWDKEACIYPTVDWGRFSFVRLRSEEGSRGTMSYRHQEEALDFVDEVRERLRQSSQPLSAQDLGLGKSNESRWGSADIGNVVLSYLWSRGDALIADRKERRKFYQSSERLQDLPTFDNEADFLDWYVLRRLSALGVYWLKNGAAWQGHYLKERKTVIKRLLVTGQVIKIAVEGVKTPLYMTTENYQRLLISCKNTEKLDQLRFIAPLDNFIWDRKFVQEIFDFDYVWEVYKPVKQRKFGYYVLPILYGDKFIGRLEPSRDKNRQDSLEIENLWFEDEKYDNDSIRQLIDTEVSRYNELMKRRNS